MNQPRSIMNLAAAPWNDLLPALQKTNPGLQTARQKLLTAPDGLKVGLINLDGPHGSHFHTKSSTLFILEGSIELRGKRCGPGTWVIEPYGSIHLETRSRNVTYGIGMSDGDFGVGNVKLASPDDIPQWVTDLGFKVDALAGAVDTAAVAWRPFGPGLSMKVLHVFDRSPKFAALVKAEAGATLPRRRYLGPADMYVLSGRIDFADGATAEPGWWIHEPASAEDGIVTFPVETEFLANTYGAILEFDSAGALTRAIEGYSIDALLAAASPQPA